MLAVRALLLFAASTLGLALSSCREWPRPPAGGGSAAPSAEANAATRGGAAEREVRRASLEQAKSRAEQVCRLLQGGPAERRAACCGGSPGGHLEPQCVRVLSEALAAGRLALDEQAMRRCSGALPAALAGCDWVTPGQPLPPDECGALTRGRVSASGACRSSLECAPPLHCEGATATEAGRCSPPLPEGAACRAPSDTLAALSFARGLEQKHPTCAGVCSLASHRCERTPPANERAAPEERAGRSGAGLPGSACRTDFDCQRGGCTAGVCGAKCAVSLADVARLSSLPALALPRRSPAR
jgi:hypothetical protein